MKFTLQLLVVLGALLALVACGGDEGSNVSPVNACGNTCPDSECFAGTCVGNNGDPDAGDDVDAEPDADVDDGACSADGDCADSEYCALEGATGVCTAGCRDGGCGDDATCDLATRACVQDPVGDCVEDRDCPRFSICEPGEDDLGVCVEGCRVDDDCPRELSCDADSKTCVADACEGAEDCPVGQYCDADLGFCRLGCAESVDCGEGLDCVDGACQGEACDGETCPAGQYCDTDAGVCLLGCQGDVNCAEGEYCDDDASTCYVGCRDDDECDEGESCRLLGVADGLRQRCVPTPCGADGDCERGFFCDLNGDDGLCSAGCRLDPDDCSEGLVCDSDARQCVPAACEGQEDCAAGQYCDTLQVTATCAVGCDANEQCRTESCDLGLHLCECERNSDCHDGLSCFGNRCIRACESDLDCPSPLTCDRGTDVCRLECEDDEFEPNNIDSPATIEEGSQTLAMCNDAVNGLEFNDCFALTLRFEETLTVSIDFEHQDGDLDLRLYDEDLSLVRLSQTQTDGEEIVYFVEDNGSYIVCVEPQGEAFSTTYTIDVGIEDVPPMCFEDANEALGDNNCSDARQHIEPLPLEEDILIDGRTLCEGDEDWLAVRLRLGQILNATITRTEGTAEIDVELIQNDCDFIVAQSEGQGNIRTLQFTSDTDGIFYLRSFTEQVLQTAGYDLNLRLEPGDFQCPEDVVDGLPAEPNDESGEATFLELQRDEVFRHDDLYLCSEDEDWYAIRIDVPSDRIRATLRQSLDDAPLGIAIVSVDGTTVLNQNIELVEQKTVESLSLPEAGVYYVRVTGVDEVPDTGVNYDLELTVFPDETCVEDGFEPDDVFGDATQVGDGEHLATMCREDAEELDFYALDLSAGDTVEITVEYDHTRIAPLDALPAILYGPGGQDDFRDFSIRDGVRDTDVFLGGSFRVTPDDEGLWYVEVGAGGMGRFVEYTLNVSIIPAECDAEDDVFEPNEDCAMAHEMQLGDQIDGFVCGLTGDVDWFSVDVGAGEDLTVAMDYFHFDGNLDLEVYEAESMTYVGGSFNNGPNFEEVVVSDTMDGTYCIRVYTGNSLTQNDYSLSVSVAE